MREIASPPKQLDLQLKEQAKAAPGRRTPK